MDSPIRYNADNLLIIKERDTATPSLPVLTTSVPEMIQDPVLEIPPVPPLCDTVLTLCDFQLTINNLHDTSVPSIITPIVSEIDRPEHVLESTPYLQDSPTAVTVDHQTIADFTLTDLPKNAVMISSDPAIIDHLEFAKQIILPDPKISVALNAAIWTALNAKFDITAFSLKSDSVSNIMDHPDDLPPLLESSDDDDAYNFRPPTSKIRKEHAFAVSGPPVFFSDDALLFGYDLSEPGTFVIANSIQMDNIATYLQFWPPHWPQQVGYLGYPRLHPDNDAGNRHNTSAIVETNWSPVLHNRYRLRHRGETSGSPVRRRRRHRT